MALGPFSTYVAPGVYSRTLTDANVSALISGLRIPVLIGVGQEELEQDDLELVRGSSSTLDEQIVNEDVSLSWIVSNTNPSNPILGAQDGTLTTFVVKNGPIVDGQGFGRVTSDVRSVAVTVNGTPVAIGMVSGKTSQVTLQVPPSVGDAVRVTYFFHRGDTAFTDDVSDQVTSTVAVLVSPGYAPFNVVSGQSDTFKLKVNGSTESTVTFVASPSVASSVTLPGADANGGVIYTAASTGVAGNTITVSQVVAGNSTPLSVSVTGSAITVNLATGVGGAATSTATQVAAAIAASGPATALVVATATGTGASLALAATATNLAGGADGGSASGLKSQIDAANLPGLTTTVFLANDGSSRLQLSAQVSLQITDGSANGILGWSNGTQSSRNAVFQVFQRPIVDGSGGGVTTTDPSKVVVKVNGTQVIPTLIDGKNGLVTLPAAPAPGAVVTINYWANTWQDTFDYLPNTLVTNVIRAGISPSRSDYIQGQDFVVSNPSPDVSIIHWGTSYAVSSTATTAGATPFNGSQITPTLVDDKIFLAPCAPVVNSAVIPAVTSTTQFILPLTPTVGNGRDTPLGLATYNTVANGRQDVSSNRPDLITVRVGRTLADALTRPAAKVVAVDSTTNIITLQSAVPPDFNCYATFWYNRIEDDTLIVTCQTPGPVGSGQYQVYSTLNSTNLFQVRFKQKGGGLTEVIQWPRGSETIPDAFHHGGTPVSETVRVTFGTAPATPAVYTTKGAGPWSFYTPASGTWRTALNSQGTVATNLATATRAYLVGKRVVTSGLSTALVAGANDLELTIDGHTVSVSLPTAGAATPTSIVTAINAAIDSSAAFTATAPNNLCTALTASGGTCFFVLRSYSTPAALPGGFDHNATVAIRQGTAETALGFTTFQSASGTPGAINKAATLLGSKAGPFTWTAGVNDKLKIRVNGVDYTVTVQTTSTSASLVAADINAVLPTSQGAASAATLGNANQVRLTSATNSDQSAIVILDGTANSVLGFNQGDFASQTRVQVQEVVDRLMDSVGFAVTSWTGTPTVNALGGVAYVTSLNNLSYLTIESLNSGSASSVAFVDGVNSAFNTLSGTLITPGTDGDNGSASYDNYTVTSTNPAGSSGTGIPGQTYTDATTGLRFSVLPAASNHYDSNGWFEMDVSSTFNVTPAIPYYAMPGLELIVSNTVGVGVGDTAQVQTYNPNGLEPNNGDFYFISYRYMKQDFSTQIFQQFKSITAAFGDLSPENRVTLGAYLAILNGAVLVGIQQVLKVPNTNQASAATFISAIQALSTPLPGNIKPDIIVPLGTDTSIYSQLTQHCEVMSNIRNQSERMGFVGFASGTSPTNVQSIVGGLQSNRMVAFYPDSAVVTLQDELGQTSETLVDGSFFAAAVSGVVVSPSVDVATPYTRRTVQGFTRIPRILDAVEANQTAVAGVTLLEDLGSVIRIRQGLTTDMTSILTRLPTVTQIADYVSQQTRSTLDSFVGTKFLASRVNDIEVSMTSLFKTLVQQEIVGGYTGISANVDPDDPTILQAEAYYQPVFPLLYIVLTFNLRAKI